MVGEIHQENHEENMFMDVKKQLWQLVLSFPHGSWGLIQNIRLGANVLTH